MSVFRSSFFWKLYLTFSILFLVINGAIAWVVTERVQKTLSNQMEASLSVSATVLAPLVQQVFERRQIVVWDPASEVRRIALETGSRISLILADGTVLADSQEDPLSMPSQSTAPEILAALARPSTSTFTRSPSGNDLIMARALQGQDGQTHGFLKVSLPATRLETSIHAIRETLVILTIAGSLVALCLGVYFAWRIAVPVDTMIRDHHRLESVRRDFVANVSHELKTPLTSIKGYVETLLGGALHDEKNNVRFLEKIQSNVTRLVNLTQDLLSLARIEASERDELLLSPIRWDSIIQSAIHRHEVTVDAKKLTIHYEAVNPLVEVMGDRDSMTQVFENLYDNAVKYTPAGGTVTIVLRIEEAHGVVAVRDTGIGIPPEDIDRVFERFYRVDKARSREVGGTGLGLSIVKHLVMRMKGKIKLVSEVGKGSEFIVSMPLASDQ